jgi:hypothetical protein
MNERMTDVISAPDAHRPSANFQLDCRHVAIAVALLFVTASAHARDIVSTKSKISEISVTLDDALNAYPALAANLAAEGKTWAAKARKEAASEYRPNNPAFRDGMAWTFSRTYDLRSAIGRYISVTRNDDTYEGGAHPYQTVNTILWDNGSGKRSSMRPFFIETANNGPTMTAVAKMVREAVAAEKKARGGEVAADLNSDYWLKEIKPSLLKIGALALAPSDQPRKSSGLLVYFSPATVGPYAEGVYHAFVPWREFEPSLSETGLKLFGGMRPKGDGEK